MPERTRIASLDVLRGLVMALMLVDHVREFFLLHRQVPDPMRIAETPPELFATRLATHLCAPVFVLLAGIGAWLHARSPGASLAATSRYLAVRGLLLVVLELTVIGFAWTFEFPPHRIYLQVIWAIGLSMIALALLIRLPRGLQFALAFAIIAGHNALDAIHVAKGEPGFVLWSILHDRNVIELGDGVQARTSYPVLPWIGIILLGYALGPLFAPDVASRRRRLVLAAAGVASLAAFLALRLANVYGDRPWTPGADAVETAMAFLNVTKYPPSLLFTLLTLGVGLLALAALERARPRQPLAVLGSVPMFFYVVHLYALHLLYLACLGVAGPNHGDRFGVDGVWPLWALSVPVLLALYWPCVAYARYRLTTAGRWVRYL